LKVHTEKYIKQLNETLKGLDNEQKVPYSPSLIILTLLSGKAWHDHNRVKHNEKYSRNVCGKFSSKSI
jgi:hypothetical protein